MQVIVILQKHYMKHIMVFALAAALLTACNKNSLNPATADEFVFGTSYGFCVGDCARFYQIKDTQVYADEMDRFDYKTLQFKTTALPADKYQLAKQLLDEFPQYLLNNPDSTFGCPDCSDGGLAYIKLKQHGKVTTWIIDLQRLQPELTDYVEKMRDVISKLR